MDRSEWGSGPWDGEPDKVEWVMYGMLCTVLRIPTLGHLCGYLTLPPDHPWVSLPYIDIPCTVHGGLTYKDGTKIGFDCAHAGDLAPCLDLRLAHYGVYRDINYMTKELILLARQAHDSVTR